MIQERLNLTITVLHEQVLTEFKQELEELCARHNATQRMTIVQEVPGVAQGQAARKRNTAFTIRECQIFWLLREANLRKKSPIILAFQKVQSKPKHGPCSRNLISQNAVKFSLYPRKF